MYCLSSDQKQIYYELRGNAGSEHCIVFLNGLTQATYSWAFFLPYFEKRYKIILLDLIFQGKSDKTGDWRNFDTHARDVFRVLEQERIFRANIIGISYGSLVAQHFTLLYPDVVEKLVLLATFAHKTPYYEAIELAWWRSLEKGGYHLMLDVMLPTVLSEAYFQNPLIPVSKMKESRAELNGDTEAIFKLMRATKERQDYRKRLREIKSPTLIIHGEKDLLLPVHLAEQVHKNIKNSQFIVVPGAGHTLNLEHIQEVCGAIGRFLDQV